MSSSEKGPMLTSTSPMCHIHPSVQGVFTCLRCQKPICQNCRRQKFGSSYCEGCFTTQSFQPSVRPVDPVVFRQPSKPSPHEAYITPALIKKVVVIGAVIWMGSHYREVKAWAMNALAPYAGKLTKIPGVSTLVNPEAAKQRGLEGVAKAQFAGFASGLNTYRSLNGHYPDDFQNFLRENFSSEAMNRNLAADPWNIPVQYTKRLNGYELRSAGPDQLWMTGDDIIYTKDE